MSLLKYAILLKADRCLTYGLTARSFSWNEESPMGQTHNGSASATYAARAAIQRRELLLRHWAESADCHPFSFKSCPSNWTVL